MKTNKFNFTIANITSLKLPLKGTKTFYDARERGLTLIVSYGGSKTFYLYKKIDGRPERIKIGRFPDVSVEQARKKATHFKTDITNGKNPNEEKNKLRASISLKKLFAVYMERHAIPHKKTWKEDKRQFNQYCNKLSKKTAIKITKQEINALHKRIATDNGKYASNRLLALLKVVFNKGIEWGLNNTNPAEKVKKFKEKSRERFLKQGEFPKFINSLEQEENMIIKKFFWILLLTGQRKSNVLAMRWEEIDFNRKVWIIPETKNGDSLTVPLVDRAIILLKELENCKDSDWVFPSHGKTGHYQDPKSAWKRILDRANITNLRIHDIRRTMGSFQAMTGASLPLIGRSLGHKTSQATQVYARIDDDPVRTAYNKATEMMFKEKE